MQVKRRQYVLALSLMVIILTGSLLCCGSIVKKSHLIKENIVVTECMPILRAAVLEPFLLLIAFSVSVVGSVALQIPDGCRS